MTKKSISLLFIVFGIVASLSCFSLEETSKEIHKSIDNLKTEITDLKSDLNKMEILNNQQLEDIKKLQQEKLDLNNVLDSTITQLDEYNTKIHSQTLKIKKFTKVITILGIILIVMIIIKIVIMILKTKFNINLPYWLNCIL